MQQLSRRVLLIPCLSFGLLSLLFFSVPSSLAATHQPPSTQRLAVCTGSPVPDLWVITDIWTDWSMCPVNALHLNNVENIEPAVLHTPQQVCANSPFPSYYVVLKQSTDLLHCGNTPNNVITIVTESPEATQVCASSPVPLDWVITAESGVRNDPSSVLTCQSDATHNLGRGIIERTILGPWGSPARVCADSPLPQTYHRVQHVTLPSCHYDAPGSSWLIVAVPVPPES